MLGESMWNSTLVSPPTSWCRYYMEPACFGLCPWRRYLCPCLFPLMWYNITFCVLVLISGHFLPFIAWRPIGHASVHYRCKLQSSCISTFRCDWIQYNLALYEGPPVHSLIFRRSEIVCSILFPLLNLVHPNMLDGSTRYIILFKPTPILQVPIQPTSLPS